MLETPGERMELLRTGIESRTIEKLYLIYNNFKIVHIPSLFEIVEINFESNGFVRAIEKMLNKHNSFIDLPHLVERFSMFGIPKFIYGFNAYPKLIPAR